MKDSKTVDDVRTHTSNLINIKKRYRNYEAMFSLDTLKKIRNHSYFCTENGITLIALVITIIVLLILAGVTIAMLTGDNGLLRQAYKAKNETEIKSEFERIQTSVMSAQIESEEELTKENIEKALSSEFEKDVTLNGSDTWIYEGEYKNYYIFQNGKIQEKEEYSELSIGDYVNYNVYYENLNSYNNEYKVKDEYTGWRILSIDKQNNVVRLVSAGIPLTYGYGYGNTSQEIEKLTSNFLDDSTVYQKYGFKENDNDLITNNSVMKSLFLNNFTKQKDNFPDVSSLTKKDIEGALGRGIGWGNFIEWDLFSIPCNSLNDGKYANYWLASDYYSQQLWSVSIEGKVVNQNNKTIWIRPVVTLVSNIKFTKDEELSVNDKIVWNINLQD